MTNKTDQLTVLTDKLHKLHAIQSTLTEDLEAMPCPSLRREYRNNERRIARTRARIAKLAALAFLEVD